MHSLTTDEPSVLTAREYVVRKDGRPVHVGRERMTRLQRSSWGPCYRENAEPIPDEWITDRGGRRVFRWLTALVWSTGEVSIRGRLVYVDSDGMALDTGETGARMGLAFPPFPNLEPPAHDIERAQRNRERRAQLEQARLRRVELDEEYFFEPTDEQFRVIVGQLRRNRRIGKMFDRIARE